jgi:uncharacterized protein
MNVLIAGSHGLVGSAVVRLLNEKAHNITRLVRKTPGGGEIWWNPDTGEMDTASLEGFDGVVHLATMPWPMNWTAAAKQDLRDNRLKTNRLLAESLAGCRRPPQVLICASGMGYYPSSGDTTLTEDSPAGVSFLASLQHDGETATAPAIERGIRVVHLRIPPVLGGPALQRAGFRAGDGQQWVSWIALDELASIVEFALTTDTLSGPVNPVSPNPLRSAEFADISDRVFGRNPVDVMPAAQVQQTMGEMGEEFLLASRRILPARLLAAGYPFRFPELEAALHHELQSLSLDTTQA